MDLTTSRLIQKVSKPCFPGVVNVLSLSGGEAIFHSTAILIQCYVPSRKPSWFSAGQMWQVFELGNIKAMSEKHHLIIGDNFIIFPDATPFGLRFLPHKWLKNIQVTAYEISN
jgi:hypothetical protein